MQRSWAGSASNLIRRLCSLRRTSCALKRTILMEHSFGAFVPKVR
jgi:hypothetical protein